MDTQFALGLTGSTWRPVKPNTSYQSNNTNGGISVLEPGTDIIVTLQGSAAQTVFFNMIQENYLLVLK